MVVAARLSAEKERGKGEENIRLEPLPWKLEIARIRFDPRCDTFCLAV